jgi:3',5'-nucleoside bisphosphate phosphatase
MPRGSPFTALCQALAQPSSIFIADLHAHTTASDGALSAVELVELAKKSHLKILAISDHDTTASFAPAHLYGQKIGVQVIPGVEWTTVWQERELHLLGLFLDVENAELQAALKQVCQRRRERFTLMLAALATKNLVIPQALIEQAQAQSISLGRRHVAELLVKAGHATNRADAFQRHLRNVLPTIPPTHFTPIETAIAHIHATGGLAILAHPPHSFDGNTFRELQALGLDGLEAGHPSQTPARQSELRHVATGLGLAVSAGSDFHEPATATLGYRGLVESDWLELEAKWRQNPNSSPQ